MNAETLEQLKTKAANAARTDKHSGLRYENGLALLVQDRPLTSEQRRQVAIEYHWAWGPSAPRGFPF
jgi:hypothetical protein